MTSSNELYIKAKINTYHYLVALFCLLFVVSNIAAIKVGKIYGTYLDLGTLYFPLLYIISDIVTEVYGFKASRAMIWLAVWASIGVTMLLYAVTLIPYPTEIKINSSFQVVFTFSCRILFASVVSFTIGEYINAMILSSSKIFLATKSFNVRAIFSTAVGSFTESMLFALTAFYNILSISALMNMIVMLTLIKVLYEFITLPITSRLVKYLKMRESIGCHVRP